MIKFVKEYKKIILLVLAVAASLATLTATDTDDKIIKAITNAVEQLDTEATVEETAVEVN